MVSGDERDRFDLQWLEASQVAVANQIVRVLVMALVADVDADVVEQRRVLEPLALAIGQSMDAARAVEQRQRQLRDLLGVLGHVVATFRQFDDAAAPHVGVSLRLGNLFPVTRDVVEDEPFAQ